MNTMPTTSHLAAGAPAPARSGDPLQPVLPGDATIVFEDLRAHALTGGKYRLTADIAIAPASAGAEPAPAYARYSNARSFEVRGPRFRLAPADIGSVFPPPRAHGDFSRVAPHVSLTRATLPWERAAVIPKPSEKPEEERPFPWLALVVLDAKELVRRPVEEVSEEEARKRLDLKDEDVASGPPVGVRLLTFRWDKDAPALPEHAGDLSLLSHVREVRAKTGKVMEARGAVIASQTPATPGRKILHLVSVENRYDDDGLLKATDGGEVTVVTLHSWEIFCEPGAAHDFETQTRGLTAASFGLDPGALPSGPRGMVRAGAVPLRHLRRDGSRSAAWYRGPLRGAGGAVPPVPCDLPVKRPDDLLLQDRTTGLIDASYAAAWELGRTLLLSRPRLARQLAYWKRCCRQCHAEKSCCDAMSDLPVCPAMSDMPAFPLRDFFRSDLGLLRSVPFTYLVPDVRLLPRESLRFFRIDTDWIRCLKDGAFSLGRATQADFDHDCGHCAAEPSLGTERETVTGLLLRSTLIGDWPDMLIDGFAGGERPEDGAAPLPVLRCDRLGPGVMLALFEGAVASVDLHLHARALHFEVPQAEGLHGLLRKLRDEKQRARVADPCPATRMIEGRSWPPQGSADLAAALVTSAPRVRFDAEVAP